MYESDAVKIEIKGMTVKQVMEQMASAGQAMGKSITDQFVTEEDVKRFHSKLDTLLDELGSLLQRVDVVAGGADVKSSPINDLRKAVADGYRVEDVQHSAAEAMEALGPEPVIEELISKLAQQDDQLNSLGRLVEDLAGRYVDIERVIQKKISSVIDSFEEARKLERAVKKCAHEPIKIEYLLYTDGVETNRSIQPIMSWSGWTGDKANMSFDYELDGQSIIEAKFYVCRKCNALYCVVKFRDGKEEII